MSNLEMPGNDFRKGNLIGEGGFSHVFKAENITPLNSCNDERIRSAVLDKIRPDEDDHPQDMPQYMRDVTRQCWQHEPDDRPTMTDVAHTMNSKIMTSTR
jgi:hypothetical protein